MNSPYGTRSAFPWASRAFQEAQRMSREQTAPEPSQEQKQGQPVKEDDPYAPIRKQGGDLGVVTAKIFHKIRRHGGGWLPASAKDTELTKEEWQSLKRSGPRKG